MGDLGGAGKEDAVPAEAEAAGRGADHLVVMVHGIVGSAADWKFGAEQFNKLLLDKVIVHCSNCNMHKTLDGVDVMGERLAQEVIEETNRRPQVKKISFVAHSVGGLVARYAIGILYRPPKQTSQDPSQITGKNYRGIHGLEAVNFITVASPHLGSRGNKQVPCLLGVTAIENFACCIIHMIFGKTGKHLFLNDNDDGKPPLLQRMVDDWGDRHFMSALQAFKRRVTYSNVGHDHIVGWRTSSIRRSSELPEWVDSTEERYPHIVNEEQSEAENVNQYFDIATTCVDNCTLEERLLRGLRRVSWEKVDVSFHNSKARSAAHSVIQVKDPIMHAEGADVIQHMIDNFVIKGNPEFWA